jgi:phage FluMu protein Com
MPGGGCPYCNKIIINARRGRQGCPHCRGAINVEIKHDPDTGGTRTYLRAEDDKRRKLADERRWDELKKEKRMEKVTAFFKGE